MLFTTLNNIRQHRPCATGWERLLQSLGKTKADDKKLSLAATLKSNGISDALWCLRAVENAEIFARRFALDCARRVERLSDDPRVKACNDTTEAVLAGKATEEAWDAAGAAAGAAAWDAAGAAARAAAWAAAWAAAGAAAWAAAGAAARAAAGAAAGDAEKKWQTRHLAACLKAWPKSKWPVTK